MQPTRQATLHGARLTIAGHCRAAAASDGKQLYLFGGIGLMIMRCGKLDLYVLRVQELFEVVGTFIV